MRANNSRHRPQKFRLFEERNLVGVFQNQLEAVKASIDPFHVYVNEVELEDKTITRSDV